MKFEVSRSLDNVTGGLIGMAIIAKMGFDWFVINNEYSVLVSKDHVSVKNFGGKKISKAMVKKIAEYMKYKQYHTEGNGCMYIFNDTPKGKGKKHGNTDRAN